jgi:hypothetical protein
MFFMVFEHLIATPLEELDKLFAFLGVDSDAFEYRDEPRNQTRLPRWPSLTWAARQVFGRTPPMEFIGSLNMLGNPPGYPKLGALRDTLAREFREDNARLGELIEKDLSLWDPK